MKEIGNHRKKLVFIGYQQDSESIRMAGFHPPKRSSPPGWYRMKPEKSRVRSILSPLRALDVPGYIRCGDSGDELIRMAENDPALYLETHFPESNSQQTIATQWFVGYYAFQI
jgi:hypothetical protein